MGGHTGRKVHVYMEKLLKEALLANIISTSGEISPTFSVFVGSSEKGYMVYMF